MAERSTIEMGDRELFAAMAMQALITREGWAADMTASKAVAYADALIEGLGCNSPEATSLMAAAKKKPRRFPYEALFGI
jgi:hypothetical protein